MECPFAFWQEYIKLNVVKGKNNAFAIGSGIHDAIEQMTLDKVQEGLKPVQHYEAVYRNSALNSDDLMPVTMLKRGGKEVPFTGEQVVGHYENIIGSYYNSGQILTPKKRAKPYKGSWYYTEGWGRLHIDDFDVVIKTDIITDKAIVDYKTGSKKFSVDEVNEPLKPKGLQASVYGSWFYQEFGFCPYTGFQVIGKHDTSNPKSTQFFVQVLGFLMTESIVRDTIQLIRGCHEWFKYYLSIKKFPSNPEYSKSGCLSGKCYFCNYKRYCV